MQDQHRRAIKASSKHAWQALLDCHGDWADRDDIGTGAKYVEQIRQCKTETGTSDSFKTVGEQPA